MCDGDVVCVCMLRHVVSTYAECSIGNVFNIEAFVVSVYVRVYTRIYLLWDVYSSI